MWKSCEFPLFSKAIINISMRINQRRSGKKCGCIYRCIYTIFTGRYIDSENENHKTLQLGVVTWALIWLKAIESHPHFRKRDVTLHMWIWLIPHLHPSPLHFASVPTSTLPSSTPTPLMMLVAHSRATGRSGKIIAQCICLWTLSG